MADLEAQVEQEFRANTQRFRDLFASYEASIDDEDKLYMYARFKQATVGDCREEAPSFNITESQRKTHAWLALQGQDRFICMAEYSMKLNAIMRQLGVVA